MYKSSFIPTAAQQMLESSILAQVVCSIPSHFMYALLLCAECVDPVWYTHALFKRSVIKKSFINCLDP